jgi:hypothetical protein
VHIDVQGPVVEATTLGHRSKAPSVCALRRRLGSANRPGPSAEYLPELSEAVSNDYGEGAVGVAPFRTAQRRVVDRRACPDFGCQPVGSTLRQLGAAAPRSDEMDRAVSRSGDVCRAFRRLDPDGDLIWDEEDIQGSRGWRERKGPSLGLPNLRSWSRKPLEHYRDPIAAESTKLREGSCGGMLQIDHGDEPPVDA